MNFIVVEKKTIVLGASTNPARYSNMATLRLTAAHHPVEAIGVREGQIGETSIQTGKPEVANVDTVTLYLNLQRQHDYYDYIIGLKPKRIIFNPGTENPELREMAQNAGIETVEACTLVMLSTGLY